MLRPLRGAWNGPGGGGSNWDFPLQVRGDGTRVVAAIKKMQLGDMPSFDPIMQMAFDGLKAVFDNIIASYRATK